MNRTFTVIECEQRSDVWRQARCGLLTASRAGQMLATIKTGEAAARRDYRMQLMCERLVGRPQDDDFMNAAMLRGVECEPLARAAYEARTGALVSECGFLRHRTHLAGCSLDGYLGDFETVVSFKCPKTATHLRYLQDRRFPLDYEPQMLHELWITGARHYDFFSWDDRLPAHLQTFVMSVARASLETAIKDYEVKALAFLAEVADQVAQLERMSA